MDLPTLWMNESMLARNVMTDDGTCWDAAVYSLQRHEIDEGSQLLMVVGRGDA